MLKFKFVGFVFIAIIAIMSAANANDGFPDWDITLVGHRGLSPDFPENTLAAFSNSILLGVDVIELDLRGTLDGEVVIMHDETVDRTTNGTGIVTDLTLAQLKQLDAGSYVDPKFSNERIPTFQEVLELMQGSGVKLLLDIKVSPVLNKEKIVRLTEQYNATLDVIAGIRTTNDLMEFRALNPNIRTLGFIPSPEAIEEFVKAGVDIVRLWPRWINADIQQNQCSDRRLVPGQESKLVLPGGQSCLILKVHEFGKPVWSTAGIANKDELRDLIRLGVNGILTDLPEVLSELLLELKK